MIPTPAASKEPRGRWLFEMTPQPVWLVRLRDLKLLDVNDAACTHFGYSRRECRKLSLEDLLTESDLARFRKAAAGANSASPDLAGYRVRTAHGTFIDTDLS